MIEAVRPADRYELAERWDPASAGAARALGRDVKLDRAVLLWVLEAPARDPRRAELLEAARVAGRLSHPAFLQVLDVAIEDERTTVVLEAAGGLGAQQHLEPGLPALPAATLTLDVGWALEEAARQGLRARRLPLTYVYLHSDEDVRLDPVGVFGPPDPGPDGPPATVALLCDLLASLLLPPGDRGTRFDPGASTVESLIARWRERGPDIPERELPVFLGELRLVATGGAPRERDGTAPETPRYGREAAPRADDPTMPLPALGRAAAGGAPPIAPPRTSASARPVPAPTRQGGGTSAVALILMLVGLVAGVGAGVLAFNELRGRDSNTRAAAPPTATTTAPPGTASAPAEVGPNRATLGLAAERDAEIRVTVDGTQVFAGVLRPGETRSWEGRRSVQVWTNNGKALITTVNGFPLGQLSAAVGHPEWNTVEWSWPAGWKP